jgi:hypothetical protein
MLFCVLLNAHQNNTLGNFLLELPNYNNNTMINKMGKGDVRIMKKNFGIKLATVGIIISIFILATVIVPANAKEKHKEDIIVTCPQPHQCVTSPLAVQGKASGSWFFEATFPLSLVDAQGNQLSTSKATAIGDWTTKKLIPFQGKLDFTVTKATKAKLVLQNDNPSGLPENSREKEIPVTLMPKK